MTRSNSKNSRGFTLIELLVVIAIIGILSAVVLTSLNSARQKARDARRISDIKQIQLALELAYDASTTASYPAALSIATLVTPGYMPSVPKDPSDQSDYGYVQTGSGTGYILGAQLETSNSVLASDYDTAQAITLRGAAADCSTGAGSPGASELIYCVTP